MNKHLSPSQIKKYLGCGEDYRFSYVERVKSPPTQNLVTGTIFHEIVKIDLINRMQAGIWFSKSELLDFALIHVNNEFAGNSETGRILISYESDTPASKAQVFSWVVALLNFYITIRESINPMIVEYPLTMEIPIPGFETKDLKIIIDLLEYNGFLSDWKTSVSSSANKSFSAKSKLVHNDIALTAYTIATILKTGNWPKKIFYRAITVHPQNLKIEYQEIHTTRNYEDIRIFFELVRQVIIASENSLFPPTALGTWKCSRKYCYYYNICKYINQITAQIELEKIKEKENHNDNDDNE